MKGSKGRRDQGALSLGNLLGGRRPRLTCEQKQEALIDKLTTECGEEAGCLAIVTAFEEELVTCDELQAAQDEISDAQDALRDLVEGNWEATCEAVCEVANEVNDLE